MTRKIVPNKTRITSQAGSVLQARGLDWGELSHYARLFGRPRYSLGLMFWKLFRPWTSGCVSAKWAIRVVKCSLEERDREGKKDETWKFKFQIFLSHAYELNTSIYSSARAIHVFEHKRGLFLHRHLFSKGGLDKKVARCSQQASPKNVRTPLYTLDHKLQGV